MPIRAKQARPSRRFASIREAAAALGCHPKTIRRRIADGTIHGYRMGRLFRVDLNELEAAFKPIPTAGGGDAA